ncbi:hypothetical protein [Geoalkalibacter sp.]|uniref:hypothetical protein n=1 Tax=Geoalkalibacter sp. TaxID=3041440 RepID=UPI00272DF5D8|nr:hypothetical protein [Geoalkalibacter sp.]
MRAKSVMGALMMVLAGAAPALAASAREDSSGIVVWVFLGFCALIVVAQLMPAVLMMLGVIKSVARDKEFTPQKIQNK